MTNGSGMNRESELPSVTLYVQLSLYHSFLLSSKAVFTVLKISQICQGPGVLFKLLYYLSSQPQFFFSF